MRDEHEERAIESHGEDCEGNREVAHGEIEATTQFEDSAHPGDHCQSLQTLTEHSSLRLNDPCLLFT